ncbi:phosphatidylinositol-specific phospholipase C domain-containing protein [Chryseobacterium sp. POE27]|uniref:phosphatidylinositol-specific phospholipase C domain-containing protein n=1 Tax=Chryseobacterium sp. POE27 TaxID=3138177 RepID=UPI00321B5333
MNTIQFGLAEQYDSGRNCNVAVNSQFAVEVHNSEASSDMWYHVGSMNGATINWGASHKYSSGYHPSVAVNSNNVVVEVHETSNAFTNSMYYKVGTINGDTIDWGGDEKYDSGRQPSVSVNDQGVVVEVHKSQSYDSLYYRVGQIKGKKIEWGDSHKYDDGVTPSVSINNDGLVVEVHKSQAYNKLWCRVGRINGKSITWGSAHEYQDGIAPSVGLTNDGTVVEVHESQGLTGLWQLVGKVNGNEITWGGSSNFDSGANPQVGVSLNGNVAVQVHEGSMYQLWYSNSKVMDTANFMKNMLPVISNLPLKKMVLPATHDTGMYAGGLAGRTQDLNLYEQLSSGSRYFDLRLDGNLNIRHGIVYGPSLDSVLKNIKQFFDEGHQELAILKFSHFDDFSQTSYQNMRNLINSYLGNWLFKTLPQGVSRLADVSMGTYLNAGKGAVLIVVDGDWAIDYPEAGYWVYRDWNSGSPAKGNLTVFDQYSDTTDLAKMENDQFEKLRNFNGKCKNDPQVPCDLFLLSWTLTPVTAVWSYAQDANRVLGRKMMSQRQPNQFGYFSNLLYLDYFQYARPVFIADILFKSYNKI